MDCDSFPAIRARTVSHSYLRILRITIVENSRGSGKFFGGSNTLAFGYSSRKGAKTLSSEGKTPCHFDRREKSFLDPSHSLGMTGLGSSPLRLGVFAGDIPVFGCGFAALSSLRLNDPRLPSEGAMNRAPTL